MDPSDLLPGLARMLEERIRAPWGYRVGTVIVLAAAGAIILSPVVMVAIIIGAASAVFEWQPLDFGGHAVAIAALVGGTLAGLIVLRACVRRWVLRGVERRVQAHAERAFRQRQRAAAHLERAEQVMGRSPRLTGADRARLEALEAQCTLMESLCELVARRAGLDIDELKAVAERSVRPPNAPPESLTPPRPSDTL